MRKGVGGKGKERTGEHIKQEHEQNTKAHRPQVKAEGGTHKATTQEENRTKGQGAKQQGTAKGGECYTQANNTGEREPQGTRQGRRAGGYTQANNTREKRTPPRTPTHEQAHKAINTTGEQHKGK